MSITIIVVEPQKRSAVAAIGFNSFGADVCARVVKYNIIQQ